MADNEILFKGDISQLKGKLSELTAAFDALEESIKSGAKTAAEAAKEQKAILELQAKLAKALEKAEKQARKEAEQDKKKAAAEEKKRQDDLSKRRRDAAKVENDLNKNAIADLQRLEAQLAKLRSPAEQYVAKLRDWKAALQANGISQEQFNRLKDAELAKLNATAEAAGKAAREAAAADEQKKKNIAARLRLEQIRAKEQAAIDAREKQSAAEQQKINTASAIKLAQIRKAEQAAADARKRSKEEGIRLDKEAAQIAQRNETAQERINRRLAFTQQLYQKGKLELRDYNREVVALKTELKGLESGLQESSQGLQAMGTALAGLLGTAKLVSLAIQAVNAEFDNMKQRQQEAAQSQLGLADVERDAMLNLGPQEDGGAFIRDEVDKIAAETGASRRAIWQSLDAGAASAGPTVTTPEILNAVRVSAQLQPGNAQKMMEGTTGILQQQKVTGGSTEGVAGFQLAVKRASPARDELFAKNIIPAITNMEPFGDSPSEAAALLTTIGHATGDITGATTGTAGITLGLQLMNAVPLGKSTYERIQMIRKSDKLRKHFLGTLDPEVQKQLKETQMGKKGKLTGEAAAYMPLVQLLSEEENLLQQQYEQFRREIPDVESGGTVFQETVSSINQSPLQQTALVDRALSNAVENLRSKDQAGAMTAMSRDRFKEILRGAKVANIDQWIEEFGFSLGPGANEEKPLEYITDRLRSRSDSLKAQRQRVTGGIGAPSIEIGGPNQSSLDMAEKLDQVVSVLEQTLRQIQNDNRQGLQAEQRNADRTVKAIENNKPPNPPKASPLNGHQRQLRTGGT